MNLTTLSQAFYMILFHIFSQTNIATAFPFPFLGIRERVGRPPMAFESMAIPPSSTRLPAAASDNDDVASSYSSQQPQPQQGLVTLGSALQSQLVSAFSQLDESDQYDAILTGLCAKILDNPSMKGNDVIVALQDPLNLLEEMNARRVVAGSRSIMALVDVRETPKTKTRPCLYVY
jgi:hypothetical protein